VGGVKGNPFAIPEGNYAHQPMELCSATDKPQKIGSPGIGQRQPVQRAGNFEDIFKRP